MIVSNKQLNKQQQYFSEDRKQNLKMTFSKYKSIHQGHRKDNSNIDHKIQQMFSSFTYNSLTYNRQLKISSNNLSTKVCSIESLQLSDCSSFVDFSSFLSITEQYSNKKKPILKAILSEDLQKPAYIRNFNKLNSVMPNFYHPQLCLQKQYDGLLNIIQVALSTIKQVFSYASRIAKNIKNRKSFSTFNSPILSLDYFINSGWQKYDQDIGYQSLKPTQNFEPNFCFNSIFNKLGDLLNKAVKFSVVVNLKDVIQKQLYMKIRENFSMIQKQLLQCSNSLYVIAKSNKLPDYYYTYLKILKQEDLNLSLQQITEIKQQFKQLWKNKIPIIMSEIGRAIFLKIGEIQNLLGSKKYI